jgi:alpha-mannosidase
MKEACCASLSSTPDLSPVPAYALIAGRWGTTRSYRDGIALYWPLFALSGVDPLSAKQLEPAASLCDPEADHVIVTTIKKAEAGEGTVVRGYEVVGRKVRVTPQLAGNEGAWSEVDLLEENPRPVRDQVVWQPHEIKTLKNGHH